MTAEQLEKSIGTLVLFMDRKKNWRRAKLVHVFALPKGFDDKFRCCLVQTPKFKNIIYARQIYYAFPHFNKKIRLYHEENSKLNTYKDASATKQYASAKHDGRDARIY